MTRRTSQHAQIGAAALAILLFCSGARADDPSEPLAGLLKRAGSGCALVVEDARSGAAVFAHQPQRQLKPASVQKLLTTAAALARFGPRFAFETRVCYSPAAGGELWIIGSGDPSLGDERIEQRAGVARLAFLDEWARRLREMSVQRVQRIVLDDSVFGDSFTHPDWPAEQYLAWYQAPSGALNINDNCLDVRLTLAGQSLRAECLPPLPEEMFNSLLKRGGKHAPRLQRASREDVFSLSGTATRGGDLSPASCGNPTIFFGYSVAEGLRRRGIDVGPDLVRRRIERTRADAAAQVSVHRTPLTDVVWRANTFSQNLFADCLLKSLAAYEPDGRRSGISGDWENGAAILRSELLKIGVDLSGASVRDGSGLSPTNRASAAQVARLLTVMHRHPQGAVFRSSLAAPGAEGTMRRRMREPELVERVRAKTGTLRDVSTLAGYVTRPDGTVFSFALLMNDNLSPDLGTQVCRVLAGSTGKRR